MAKKQETKIEVEKISQVVEQPLVMETPKPKKVKKKLSNLEDDWEIKDRTYFLTKKRKPLSYIVKSSNIYYFDEGKGYERELKNTNNIK